MTNGRDLADMGRSNAAALQGREGGGRFMKWKEKHAVIRKLDKQALKLYSRRRAAKEAGWNSWIRLGFNELGQSRKKDSFGEEQQR